MENRVIVTETGITVRVIPQVVNVTATVGSATGSGGGGGVTDHGDLTGLADDDHTQYLNNARGDVRYAPIVHTHAIADVTGLQTALDGKQAAGSYAAATHTHVIADVTGLQLSLNQKSGIHKSYVDIENALGSTVLAYAAGGPLNSDFSNSTALPDGRAYYTAIWIPYDMTITGVEFYQGVQGVFVGDAENAIALYTYSGGTITRVAISANDQNIWKGTSQSRQRVAFTAPYNATRGLHYIGTLYNSSSQTTAPTLSSTANTLTNCLSSGYSNSAKVQGSRSTQTALPASESMTNIVVDIRFHYLAVY